MFELINMIAKRKGIGNDLANGAVAASKSLNIGQDKVAHSKGLELPAWDPRTALGMAICYATGPTGGDHCKGWTVSDDVNSGKNRLKTIEKVDRAIKSQNKSALSDTLGTCMFSDFLYSPTVWTNCINTIEANTLTEKKLNQIGERVFQLEYRINKKLGHRLEDNILPKRIVGYEIQVEGKAFTLTERMFKEMINEYNLKRGWNKI